MTLPDAAPGIGFDDLGYDPALQRVLVPAGRSGRLDLVDPSTLAVTPVAGFRSSNHYAGGHDFGVTSVDTGPSVLFATDRTAMELSTIDAHSLRRMASAKLGAGPDYVRFVSPTHEVWVTEPDADRIEIFPAQAPRRSIGTIAIKGGPESLVIDAVRGVAYTHLWRGRTLELDVKSRSIMANWPNGCRGSRGIALDPARRFVFVGCAEGRAVVLDGASGATLSTLSVGAGVDIIAYAPRLAHLYVPSARAATLSILGVGAKGRLTLLGRVPTALGAHCVTADDRGDAYVCDPAHGRLLVFRDSYPETPH